MTECGLTQKALADVLDVPLQRVKRLVGGEAKKLTREETEALMRKLHVRTDWLASGEGPMLQPALNKQTESLLALVRSASEVAGHLPVSQAHKTLVQEVLVFAQQGNLDQLTVALERFTALTPDEAALLDNYRNTAEEKRSAIREVGAALAQPRAVKKGRAA